MSVSNDRNFNRPQSQPQLASPQDEFLFRMAPMNRTIAWFALLGLSISGHLTFSLFFVAMITLFYMVDPIPPTRHLPTLVQRTDWADLPFLAVGILIDRTMSINIPMALGIIALWTVGGFALRLAVVVRRERRGGDE